MLNVIWNFMGQSMADIIDSIEIDHLDFAKWSKYYIMKIRLWILNIYTTLTIRPIAMKNLIAGLVTKDHVVMAAIPGLIAQYWPHFQSQHAIYN
jgi:hypothetical protein